jgi:diketogulonate reductase-like aldo/keto reductase
MPNVGWRREDTIVSNKLWWEFWPDESPAEELAGSLARMRLDYIDLIYAEVPPDGVALEDAISSRGWRPRWRRAGIWLRWPAT